jgi:hypothetical protein
MRGKIINVLKIFCSLVLFFLLVLLGLFLLTEQMSRSTGIHSWT